MRAGKRCVDQSFASSQHKVAPDDRKPRQYERRRRHQHDDAKRSEALEVAALRQIEKQHRHGLGLGPVEEQGCAHLARGRNEDQEPCADQAAPKERADNARIIPHSNGAQRPDPRDASALLSESIAPPFDQRRQPLLGFLQWHVWREHYILDPLASRQFRDDLRSRRLIVRAGDDLRTREPGRILSPSATVRLEHDDYRSGSEVAALKLDADRGILSACNTAGGAEHGARR